MKKSSEKQLLSYSIPISGLSNGMHTYNYLIDENFFDCFEASIIKSGMLKVRLDLDKRPGIYELDFEIEGVVKTECDRCLEPMHLEIKSAERVLVKVGTGVSDEIAVMYISPEAEKLDVAPLIYQFIHLALPMTVTHDDIYQDCPVDIEVYLIDDEAPENNATPSVWDALKDLDIK